MSNLLSNYSQTPFRVRSTRDPPITAQISTRTNSETNYAKDTIHSTPIQSPSQLLTMTIAIEWNAKLPARRSSHHAAKWLEIFGELKGRQSVIERVENDLWMEWIQMNHIFGKRTSCASRWYPTWACSGELARSYEGFILMDSGWNAEFVCHHMPLPVVLWSRLDHIWLTK